MGSWPKYEKGWWKVFELGECLGGGRMLVMSSHQATMFYNVWVGYSIKHFDGTIQ